MSAGLPTQSLVFPTIRARPPSAGTAETLVLIALILQVIGGLIALGGIGWFFGFSLLNPYPYAGAAVTGAAIVAVLVVVFLYFAYTLSYRRIRLGEYQAAQTPTLVIGILSLFLGVLPGVFYLIGYVKLGDAIREQQMAGAGVAGSPGGFSVPPQIACRGCGRVYPLSAFAFCPNCGQKLGA